MGLGGRLPDLPNALGRKTLLQAQRRSNGTFLSTGTDKRGVQGRGLVRFSSSLGVGTTPTATLTIQHSNDDGVADPYVAIPSTALESAFTVVTAAVGNGTQERWIDLSECKRYVRSSLVIAGAAAQGFDTFLELVGAPRPIVPDTAL